MSADDTTDRPISTLPDGMWSQPDIDTSAIDVLADAETVASIRTPARLTYSYTPGTARSAFLRGMAIVKTCIDTCGGTVTARNRDPHGLMIEIELPRA